MVILAQPLVMVALMTARPLTKDVSLLVQKFQTRVSRARLRAIRMRIL